MPKKNQSEPARENVLDVIKILAKERGIDEDT